jgi:chromosome segregation ATPase
MITNEDIQGLLQKSEKDKKALLGKILSSVQKVETVFEEKKSAADELKGRSQAAEDEIIKLLNGHVRRLETEKAELNMEVEEARESLKQLDELNDLKEQIAGLMDEVDKSRTAAENALKDKTDALEKLSKIQKQWETIMAGR